MSLGADQVWDSFHLNSSTSMPAVGLGTFRIRKEEDIMRAVDEALKAGYRLFDTAAVYSNEMHLGKALRTLLPKYDLEREDLFITSKLSPSEMSSKIIVKNAYQNSLNNLGLKYLDLYIIHFPGQTSMEPTNPKHKAFRNTAWSALTELYDDGLVKAIGVSNFTIDHLNELMKDNRVVPAINQVEWHPYFHDDDLYKFCREHNIWLQGYSPFGGVLSNGVVLQDPVVRAIASELGLSPSQVLLTWSLQRRVAVIPKSTDPSHIRANFMFDVKLNDEQMENLNKLNSGKKFAWDPTPYL